MVATETTDAGAFTAKNSGARVYPAEAAAKEGKHEAHPHPPHSTRHGIERLFVSLMRLAQIQTQILLLHGKFTAQKIALAVGLLLAAAVFAVLGIIFLYMAVFKIMVDVIGIPQAWAYLIIAVLHVGSAVGLALFARKSIQARLKPKKDKPA